MGVGVEVGIVTQRKRMSLRQHFDDYKRGQFVFVGVGVGVEGPYDIFLSSSSSSFTAWLKRSNGNK